MESRFLYSNIFVGLVSYWGCHFGCAAPVVVGRAEVGVPPTWPQSHHGSSPHPIPRPSRLPSPGLAGAQGWVPYTHHPPDKTTILLEGKGNPVVIVLRPSDLIPKIELPSLEMPDLGAAISGGFPM